MYKSNISIQWLVTNYPIVRRPAFIKRKYLGQIGSDDQGTCICDQDTDIEANRLQGSFLAILIFARAISFEQRIRIYRRNGLFSNKAFGSNALDDAPDLAICNRDSVSSSNLFRLSFRKVLDRF